MLTLMIKMRQEFARQGWQEMSKNESGPHGEVSAFAQRSEVLEQYWRVSDLVTFEKRRSGFHSVKLGAYPPVFRYF